MTFLSCSFKEMKTEIYLKTEKIKSYFLNFIRFLMIAFLIFPFPGNAMDNNTLPTGGEITSGEGSISSSGNSMTVNQGSERMVANWSTFNIGKDASVAFQQPGSSSVALNRINDQNASEILGSLSANGQIFLLNPNGIIFGSTAQVDVGGLVASSLDLSDENFLKGSYAFEGSGGSVSNLGAIKANGGYVAFLSPQVKNEGSISASGGSVVLAAGDKVNLSIEGSSLKDYDLNPSDSEEEQSTEITTEATSSETASGDTETSLEENASTEETGSEVTDPVVSTPAVEDTSATETVITPVPSVEGTGSTPADTAESSETNQVNVDFTGDQLVQLTVDESTIKNIAENKGIISADGGMVVMTAKAVDTITQSVVNNTGIIEAKGISEQGGKIVLDALGGQTTVSGTLDVSSDAGTGGSIVATGDYVLIEDSAHLDASGATGGGEILVGGSWQGKDEAIHQATGTIVREGALLEANATHTGNGGTVVVWSDTAKTDSVTRAYGTFEAKGGVNGGDGGRIETSGHWLDVTGITANASSTQGKGGSWLLDPYSLTVTAAATTTSTLAGPPYTFSADATGTNVLNTDIQTQLNNGTSVTLQTTGTSGDGLGDGDITVSADISKTAGGNATLTLNSHQDILLQSDITSIAGQLTVNLNADSDSNGGGVYFDSGSSIVSNGGSVSIVGTSGANGSAFGNYFDATSLINVGAGNLTVTGDTISVNGAFTGTGALTIAPRTAGTTVGIAGGAGTLSLDASYFSSNFSNGFSGITIGSNTSGNLTVGNTAMTYYDPLTLKAIQDVTFNSGASLTGGIGQNAHLIVDVDSDSNFTGKITFNGSSKIDVNINTNGGNIILGGCTDPPNRSAWAPGYGIYVRGTLDAGGGNIRMHGVSTGNTGHNQNVGIYLTDSVIQTSGTGYILMHGEQRNSTYSWNSAIQTYLTGSAQGATIHTENGYIELVGTATGTGGWGVLADNANISTTGGNVTFTGSSNAGNGVCTYGAVVTTTGSGSITQTASTGRTYVGSLRANGTGDITVSAATRINRTATTTQAVGGNLSFTARGGIISDDGGALIVGGTTSLIAENVAQTTRYDITANNASNNFGGSVTVRGSNISLRDANAMDLAASTVTGNLTLQTGGALTQSGALDVDGTTSITAGAANNITLNNASNDFTGAVSVVSGNNVTLMDVNSLILGASNFSGNLSAEALAGNLTTSGVLTKNSGADATGILKATGNIVIGEDITSSLNQLDLTLWADTDNDANGSISMVGANNTDLAITTNGGDILMGGGANATTDSATGSGYGIGLRGTLNAGGGNISLRGESTGSTGDYQNMGVYLNDSILQTTGTGYIDIYGYTSTTSLWNAGIMTYIANTSNGATFQTASGDIILSGSAPNANRGVYGHYSTFSTSGGSIDLTGASRSAAGAFGVCTQNSIFSTTGSGSITQTSTNGSNGIGRATTSGTGNISVISASKIESYAAINCGGDLNFTALGSIGTLGSSTLNVTGTSSFIAETADHATRYAVTASNASNNFGGAITVTGSNVNLRDANALDLAASTVTGNLTLQTGGALTQSGALDVDGTTSITAGAANNIILNNASNDFTGAVSVVSGYDVNITDTNALVFDDLSISHNLSLTAGGAITDSSGAIVDVVNNATLSGASINIADNAADSFFVHDGALSLTATGGGAINVNAIGSATFCRTTFNTTGSVDITNDYLTLLKGNSSAGSLNLNTAFYIADDGVSSLNVTNDAILNAQEILLTESAGDVLTVGGI